MVIAGFIIEGMKPLSLLLRGRGPSMTAFGVHDPLPDPVLTLVRADGTHLDTNDNWQQHPAAASVPADLAPTHPDESAMRVALPPGGYTVILGGTNEATGIGIVEVFDIE